MKQIQVASVDQNDDMTDGDVSGFYNMDRAGGYAEDSSSLQQPVVFNGGRSSTLGAISAASGETDSDRRDNCF
jgi:hypothetical protein